MISDEMKQLVKALVTEIVDDCYERGMATCGIESDSGEALIAAIEKLEAEFDELKADRKDVIKFLNDKVTMEADAELGRLVRRMPAYLDKEQCSTVYLVTGPLVGGWDLNLGTMDGEEIVCGSGPAPEAALKEAMGE